MTNQFEGALNWDSEISQESSFVLLPEGKYRFKVTGFERAQYTPSPQSKIRDVSPMAELDLSISSPEHGSTTVKENLILHTKMEWKISEFLLAIGQKQKGEATNPDWSKIFGAEGWCELEVNKYTNKNGEQRENNRVKQFIAVEDAPQQPVQQQPQTQTVQQPTLNQATQQHTQAAPQGQWGQNQGF